MPRRRISAMLILSWAVLVAGMPTNPNLFAEPKTSSSEQVPSPPPQAAAPEITNSLGAKLVLVRAGNFLMGAPDSDLNVPPYERPQHRVRIKKPFYLGKYEVTRGQFRKFVEATGYKTDCEQRGDGWGYLRLGEGSEFANRPKFSWRETGFEQTDEHPVVNVTWNDAVKFCEWLSKQEGKIYRLPTEAEWEWSCRAGTIERYYLGDEPETLKARINLADESLKAQDANHTVVNWNDGFAFTAPVGKFQPNPFGLYDMHGNVREWCSDWFDENEKYYANSPVNDPRGPAKGSYGVSRGGSWLYRPPACRSASRIWHARTIPNVDLGFRVLCEQSAK